MCNRLFYNDGNILSLLYSTAESKQALFIVVSLEIVLQESWDLVCNVKRSFCMGSDDG